MTIIVSSDCATGGIAAALRFFLPNEEIIPIQFDKTTPEHLHNAKVWVSTGSYTGEFDSANGLEKLQIVKIPRISFNAFHPDLTYAKCAKTGNFTKIHYNSKILVWCYNNRIDFKKIKYLFNGETYSRLGYLNYWNDSTEQLRKRFLEADLTELDFKQFFLSIKRSFVFMYSINHPKSFVLTELARVVANKLGVHSSTLTRNFVIPDGLTETVWPVYPEIATEYGVDGDYTWKIPNGICNGIEEYITYAYNNYKEQGINPSELIPFSTTQNFDQLMTEMVNAI